MVSAIKPIINLLPNTNVIVCGSGNWSGIYHVTLSTALTFTSSRTTYKKPDLLISF